MEKFVKEPETLVKLHTPSELLFHPPFKESRASSMAGALPSIPAFPEMFRNIASGEVVLQSDAPQVDAAKDGGVDGASGCLEQSLWGR